MVTEMHPFVTHIVCVFILSVYDTCNSVLFFFETKNTFVIPIACVFISSICNACNSVLYFW